MQKIINVGRFDTQTTNFLKLVRINICMDEISRKDAIEKGLMRYYTGKRCRNGHLSERYTSTRVCIECLSDWRAANMPKIVARSNEWQKRNRPHMRQYHKQWRERNADRWRELLIRSAEKRKRAKAQQKDSDAT